MCFHKWAKWEQYNAQMAKYIYATRKEIEYIECRQRRYCTKCNKEQDHKIVEN